MIPKLFFPINRVLLGQFIAIQNLLRICGLHQSSEVFRLRLVVVRHLWIHEIAITSRTVIRCAAKSSVRQGVFSPESVSS